ncbi:MAG: hypothetical protein KIT84_15985 [Labilithrix sp.]|nr:hypothetical protein [Labilithrix sp.]MCW5812528.1 hypothetical protein [Labilithrix sp.]
MTLRTLWPVLPIVAAALVATIAPRTAVADDAPIDGERSARCATRLYTAMIGEGAPAGPADVDALLEEPRFVERFARFINSQMNPAPGATPAEDAAYYLAKHVLENDEPWSEMFVGRYDVALQDANDPGSPAVVKIDLGGLGYFHSRAWMVRYAGNEPEGLRIVYAYRMMQNVIGLQLAASTNAPDADVSAAGRRAAQCAGCHFTPWFALDSVAAVLGKRVGAGDDVTFEPSTNGRQTILGDVAISNDRELAEALVANEAFDVNACRLAFKYLYGRAETSCEGPVFDRCVAAFKADKKITSALRAVAKDATFCE